MNNTLQNIPIRLNMVVGPDETNNECINCASTFETRSFYCHKNMIVVTHHGYICSDCYYRLKGFDETTMYYDKLPDDMKFNGEAVFWGV